MVPGELPSLEVRSRFLRLLTVCGSGVVVLRQFSNMNVIFLRFGLSAQWRLLEARCLWIPLGRVVIVL